MKKIYLFSISCVFLLLACTPNYVKTDIMLAEDGDAKAQCRLGDYYYNRKGMFKNYSKAVVWYTKSAKQGDADAQLKLGQCFLRGKGVVYNPKLAVEWFEKSAVQGNSDAQIELGNCYRTGRGVEANYVKAIDLYAKTFRNGGRFYLEWEAEKNNNRYAQFKLAECIFSGEEAIKWFTKSAEQGYVEAQKKLAVGYGTGLFGYTKDIKKAAYWRMKAAENGDPVSQAILGECYFIGTDGFVQDFTKAVEWLQKSIKLAGENYNKHSYYYLGHCYYFGKGVPKDTKKAFSFFAKSAQLNDSDGQYMLGLCYGLGEGTEANIVQSRYWFKLSAENGNENAKVIVSDPKFNYFDQH